MTRLFTTRHPPTTRTAPGRCTPASAHDACPLPMAVERQRRRSSPASWVLATCYDEHSNRSPALGSRLYASSQWLSRAGCCPALPTTRPPRWGRVEPRCTSPLADTREAHCAFAVPTRPPRTLYMGRPGNSHYAIPSRLVARRCSHECAHELPLNPAWFPHHEPTGCPLCRSVSIRRGRPTALPLGCRMGAGERRYLGSPGDPAQRDPRLTTRGAFVSDLTFSPLSPAIATGRADVLWTSRSPPPPLCLPLSAYLAGRASSLHAAWPFQRCPCCSYGGSDTAHGATAGGHGTTGRRPKSPACAVVAVRHSPHPALARSLAARQKYKHDTSWRPCRPCLQLDQVLPNKVHPEMRQQVYLAEASTITTCDWLEGVCRNVDAGIVGTAPQDAHSVPKPPVSMRCPMAASSGRLGCEWQAAHLLAHFYPLFPIADHTPWGCGTE